MSKGSRWDGSRQIHPRTDAVWWERPSARLGSCTLCFSLHPLTLSPSASSPRRGLTPCSKPTFRLYLPNQRALQVYAFCIDLRPTDIDLSFHLFMRSLVGSFPCPHLEGNPQRDEALANGATRLGLPFTCVCKKRSRSDSTAMIL